MNEIKTKKPIIAITMGDPAGSGPELVLKALTRGALYSKARFVLVGDATVFEKAAQIVNIDGVMLKKVRDVSEIEDMPEAINIFDVGSFNLSNVVYGKPSPAGGEASYRSIEKAVDLVLRGKADALVTAPISKESLNLSGHRYPGHTELLAELTGARYVKMMLIAKNTRVAHVTTHVSLKKAIELIKKDEVLRTIELVNVSLSELFSIPKPRIAVSGLNPHAGEGGLFGEEELKEIRPAIEEAAKGGIEVSGPYPPDSIFYRAYKNQEFDAVIAMYHDQGHIPVKMVGFMEGVNLTLGLPIIRTSPDHGTVWDKAGTGRADDTATLEAIRLAIKLARNKMNI